MAAIEEGQDRSFLSSITPSPPRLIRRPPAMYDTLQAISGTGCIKGRDASPFLEEDQHVHEFPRNWRS